MKHSKIGICFLSALVLSSCQRTDLPDRIIEQQFVHKYGFSLSPEEWKERTEDGQVISRLASGVQVAQNYENGVLHGKTTYTFPHNHQIEKVLVYDMGTLLKETLYDRQGTPVREELWELDDRRAVTLWDLRGVPLSIEEYEGDLLVQGSYFTPEHELEAKIEQGMGERVQRNRAGLLLSRDQMESGLLVQRTTYHPNGEIQSISHYHDDQLHGVQCTFSSLGRPLLEAHWDHGILDGKKTVYRNGVKVADIPYAAGERHGIENHYDDLGTLISETPWRNDRKHGCARSYSEESTESQWFFNGHAVSARRFAFLQEREAVFARWHESPVSKDLSGLR
ncbi:MAG: toxin-antitoxin system YwqK family antitoxin [Verrucomicrobiota bacterium]|nr:toxin-antitoxin system YwqK family antitoxin [Verrucomicrobiota bacterium]